MIGEIRQNFTEASASVGLILATALTEYLRVRKNSLRRVLTCQIELEFRSVGFLGEEITKYSTKNL